MVLIQLLLPTVVRTRDGLHNTAASLADTRRELEQRFDGLTAYTRSVAQGVWTAPDGRTETDDVLLIEVVAEHFDRSWWAIYASRLAAQFHQESIHVRAMTIEMPEPAPLQHPPTNLKALSLGAATSVTAIDKASLVVTLVLSLAFLSERLAWKTGLGALLIVGGAVLVSASKR